MPSFYELSEEEIAILLWAIGRATHVHDYPAPVFTGLEIRELIDRLERKL